MDKQERLQEQYEDALFALIMDKIATAEGKWAIEENERLKNDPDAAVPEDLDKRCLQTIRRHFAKQKAHIAGRFTIKALKHVVMAAGIAALMFTGAFAVSETVRVNTMNLIIEVFENKTDFHFISNSPDTVPAVTVGWLPEGYVLEEQGQDNESIWYQYQKSENESLYIYCTSTAGVGIGIDTENADVEYIEINGLQAMLVKKGDECQLAWTAKNGMVFFYVMGIGVNQADLTCIAEALTY